MTNATGIQRSFRFGLFAALLLGIWMWILPWLGTFAVVKNHVDFLQQRRINADAMFYTELTDR